MKWFRRICYTGAGLLIFFLIFYRVWFLRQPGRNIPAKENVFVSPANGKVVSVREWNQEVLRECKGDLGVINVWTKDVDTAGTIISIQMNPMNVHYQRAPTGAKVISKQYSSGSFNNAVTMCNDYGIRFENEHNELLLQTASGKNYKVIQIAGFLARRIEDYVNPGQNIKQGDVIGLIKLGSQVTVILPRGIKPKVKSGDITIDGETIIAEE